ncbi:MAG: nitrate- and nitrite sensing domain-containing protein [Gemmatimonadota bacterium]
MRLRSRRGSSRPARTRPIRSTLAALLIVPLLSLVVLWVYQTVTTAGDAISRHYYAIQYTQTSASGQALLTQIAAERRLSSILLSGPPSASRDPLNAQRARTDSAAAAFRRDALSAQAQGALGTDARQSLGELLTDLSRLPAIRSVIDTGHAGPLTMLQAYDTISNACFSFLGSQATSTTIDFSQQAEATLDVSRALDLARREDALVAAAVAAHGRMTPGERGLFAQTVGSQRLLEGQSVEEMPPSLADPFQQLFASPAYGAFAGMEDQLAAARPTAAIPILPSAWHAAAGTFLAGFDKAVVTDRAAVGVSVQQADTRTLLRLALTAGLGLLAVVLSVLLLLRFGRRLARELTNLQVAAQQIADERLPQVVEKLQHGAELDPATEAVPVALGRTSEIALVAQALSTVQRTAIEATVGQAKLRHGVSQVFLNLSRRNQSLLHRQLGMLDVMERSTGDPEALADLFRLDHLTTRMRRHAEGLIILSGASPARGWRDPVPVIDVIRAAVAEVEDYVRVDVMTEAADAVAGTAAADVVHLLAELIENATMFSPSTTRVEVRASRVGNGFAVEIEDRGIGIPAETMAELNQRLSSAPEFDLADTDQLGLFVVGRLANRHGIRIALRESAYGGVTAIVLLPHSLVLAEEDVRVVTGRALADRAGDNGSGEPAFGLTGRRQAIPAPPEAPRFMGPALPPRPLDPAAAAFSASLPPVPRLAADTGPLPAAADSGSPLAAPTADWRPAGITPPAGATPPAGDTPPAGTTPPEGGDWRGLPRRVRQASLAPQLREGPPPAPGPDPAAAQLRSPEEARAMMAALQQGWQRGREDDDPAGEQPADAPDAGTPAAGDEDEREERS